MRVTRVCKGIITGYYNNDNYINHMFNPNVDSNEIKNHLKKALPVGKVVDVKELDSKQCSGDALKQCPHKGICYFIGYYENGHYSDYTACMLNFKQIGETEDA